MWTLPRPGIKLVSLGLPWWLSGKESTCQLRRHGFHPWFRKIPQAMEQLSTCATTIEPALYSPGATTTRAPAPQQEQPPRWKAWASQPDSSPLSATREKPVQQRRPSTAKNKKYMKSGKSPGDGNGNPLQHSCLGNPMDRGSWRATVQGVAKSQTWLSN